MENYFKKSWNLLLKSFKDFNLRVIYIVLYDMIFFSIFLLSTLIFGNSVQSKAGEIGSISAENLLELAQPELEHILSVLSNFLMTLLAGFVIMAIIVFISICIFKGLVWLTISRKRPSFSYFKKFALINFLWFLLWLVPITILSITIKRELLTPALLIIAAFLVHFTHVLYIVSLDHKVIESIKKSFSIGFKKIYLFILPYTVIAVFLLVISQIYWFYSFISPNIQNVINFFVVLIFMAWSRIYVYYIVSDILEKQKVS